MQISSIEELQTQLTKTACPNCNKTKLDLRLRCDLGNDECLYLVKCGNCETNYTISTETKKLSKQRPHLEKLLTTLTCPNCGSTKAEIGFRCDLASKGCFYTIACQACGQVIKEYRS